MSGFAAAVLIVFAIFLAIGIVIPNRRNKREIENMRAIDDLRRVR